MKFRTRFYVYLVVVGVGILANFLLWRYRLHLYELNTDYEREPLQSIHGGWTSPAWMVEALEEKPAMILN